MKCGWKEVDRKMSNLDLCHHKGVGFFFPISNRKTIKESKQCVGREELRSCVLFSKYHSVYCESKSLWEELKCKGAEADVDVLSYFRGVIGWL